MFHDFVRVIVIRIDEEEKKKVFDCKTFQISFEVNVIDGSADVLEHGFIRHEQISNHGVGRYPNPAWIDGELN